MSPETDGTCCAPQHPPSPLEKDFEGLRDVNVSVSLMEDFMRCAAAGVCTSVLYWREQRREQGWHCHGSPLTLLGGPACLKSSLPCLNFAVSDCHFVWSCLAVAKHTTTYLPSRRSKVHKADTARTILCRLCIANTQRNIETIGLLGGRLSKNGTSFNIDTLIIPKQVLQRLPYSASVAQSQQAGRPPQRAGQACRPGVLQDHPLPPAQ